VQLFALLFLALTVARPSAFASDERQLDSARLIVLRAGRGLDGWKFKIENTSRVTVTLGNANLEGSYEPTNVLLQRRDASGKWKDVKWGGNDMFNFWYYLGPGKSVVFKSYIDVMSEPKAGEVVRCFIYGTIGDRSNSWHIVVSSPFVWK
jgi:hypothetical protein